MSRESALMVRRPIGLTWGHSGSVQMDPYQTPATELPEPPGAESGDFRVLPVLLGGAGVGFVGARAAYVALLFATIPDEHTSTDELERYISLLSNLEPIGLGLEGLFCLLGGYIAARSAGVRGVLHGGAAGAVSFVLNALLGPSSVLKVLLSPSSALPILLFSSFRLSAYVALGAAGVWLAARWFRRS